MSRRSFLVISQSTPKHSKTLEGGSKPGVAVGMGVQILAELVCR